MNVSTGKQILPGKRENFGHFEALSYTNPRMLMFMTLIVQILGNSYKATQGKWYQL